jgi:hypothetical protein
MDLTAKEQKNKTNVGMRKEQSFGDSFFPPECHPHPSHVLPKGRFLIGRHRSPPFVRHLFRPFRLAEDRCGEKKNL